MLSVPYLICWSEVILICSVFLSLLCSGKHIFGMLGGPCLLCSGGFILVCSAEANLICFFECFFDMLLRMFYDMLGGPCMRCPVDPKCYAGLDNL